MKTAAKELVAVNVTHTPEVRRLASPRMRDCKTCSKCPVSVVSESGWGLVQGRRR
jgi:hypothetical protein